MPKKTSTCQVENGKVGSGDYLVLENLTRDLGAPCVMDIKIGARTYGSDATDAKKKKRGAKYQGTKVTDSKVKFVSPGPLWLQCDGNFHS